MLTLDQWDLIKPQLKTGDYFYWRSSEVKAILNNALNADFQKEGYDQNWNLLAFGDSFCKYIVAFYTKEGINYITGEKDIIGIVLSKEQIIERKIQKLWNTSNYIKKNPHLAY